MINMLNFGSKGHLTTTKQKTGGSAPCCKEAKLQRQALV